jgi:VWFA-related protein
VSAFTVTGRRLWRQHWNRKRFSPVVGRSHDNRRFVVSSFTVPRWTGSVPSADENEADPDPGMDQQVQILESASGDLVRSLVASPAVLSAQNVSLSPDGSQFAILHNSEIELYDLPKVSEEEQAKFTALQADVPGLYMMSKSDSDPGSEDATDVADDLLPLPVPEARVPDDSNGPGAAPSATKISPAAPAAGKEDASQPLVTLKVSTRAVGVDVVVTDAKGHPVRGLHQRDFQLTEDGKTQNVRYFHEFDAAAARSQVVPEPVKSASNVFTNVTDAPDPGSVTVILLDFLNTPSADQPFARQQLVKFLKNKPKDLQFALCTLGADKNLSLRLIQGFTPDENLLLAAVNGNRAEAKSARWQAAAEAQNAVNTLTELARSDRTSHWENLLSGVQKMQASEQETDTNDRVSLTLDALSQLARYLSGLPGRKNLVWLSGSFPVSIAPNPEVDDPSADSHNYTGLVRQAADLMAKGQIAIYPVDVRGLAGSDVSAGTNTLGLAPLGTQSALPVAIAHAGRDGSLANAGQVSLVSPNEAFLDQSMQSFGQRTAEFETMNQVAQGTGGKAFYNSNAIEGAIATAIEQGSNYYALSYTPANKNYDGKFRKIKVALAEKGYHLNYRPGYFADDPYAPAKNGAADNIKTAAMQHGSPQSRQIRFAVRVVSVGPRKQVENAENILIASRKKTALSASVEVQHYAIDFAIDSSDLRFIAQENGDQSGALILMMAAYNEDGRQLSSLSSVWTGELSAAEYKNVISGGVRIKQELDVPIKAISLRLGIEDQKSNFLGTIELPLPVPLPPDLPRTAKHSLPEIEPE